MATTQAMCPIPGVLLAPGMQIRLEALDPATSLVVASVEVGPIAVVGVQSLAQVQALEPGAFLLVPGGPGE